MVPILCDLETSAMRRRKPELGYRKKEREKERKKKERKKKERKKGIVIRFNTFSSMKRAMSSVTGNKAKCIALNSCINSLDRFER